MTTNLKLQCWPQTQWQMWAQILAANALAGYRASMNSVALFKMCPVTAVSCSPYPTYKFHSFFLFSWSRSALILSPNTSGLHPQRHCSLGLPMRTSSLSPSVPVWVAPALPHASHPASDAPGRTWLRLPSPVQVSISFSLCLWRTLYSWSPTELCL